MANTMCLQLTGPVQFHRNRGSALYLSGKAFEKSGYVRKRFRTKSVLKFDAFMQRGALPYDPSSSRSIFQRIVHELRKTYEWLRSSGNQSPAESSTCSYDSCARAFSRKFWAGFRNSSPGRQVGRQTAVLPIHAASVRDLRESRHPEAFLRICRELAVWPLSIRHQARVSCSPDRSQRGPQS